MNDGGPAFPALNYIVPSDLEARHVHRLSETQGMTLRDYFAAKAMQSILSFARPSNPQNDMAKAAYMYADAMITERSKNSGG